MEHITILFFDLGIKIYFNTLLFISKILLKIKAVSLFLGSSSVRREVVPPNLLFSFSKSWTRWKDLKCNAHSIKNGVKLFFFPSFFLVNWHPWWRPWPRRLRESRALDRHMLCFGWRPAEWSLCHHPILFSPSFFLSVCLSFFLPSWNSKLEPKTIFLRRSAADARTICAISIFIQIKGSGKNPLQSGNSIWEHLKHLFSLWKVRITTFNTN